MKHTISALVRNRPRVLTRVAGLFARRGFNIDSLTVSTTEDPQASRMTIVVDVDDATLAQIVKQLSKLHDVTRVVDHTGEAVVEREICLVKLQMPRAQRGDVLQIVDIFRGDVVDVYADGLMLQLVGDSSKVDGFIANLEEYGITELVRTGQVVLARGSQTT